MLPTSERHVPWQWLSPVAGALAPALMFFGLALLGDNPNSGLGGFCVWALRDLMLGYVLVLPVLAASWHFGARHWLVLWAVAAATGGPLGYLIAHPAEYAWQPTEEELGSGPQWIHMLEYMALFGLSGIAYAVFSRPRAKVRTTEHVA